MLLNKIKKFLKILTRFCFEEKLKKYTNEENFYEHNMDKNYLNKLLDDKQLVNQRILFMLLFLNNIFFEILIRICLYKTISENYLNGLLGINVLSFILLIVFLFSLKKNFIKSNFYNCFMIIQFDFIFIFCFISKSLMLEFQDEIPFFNYYKIIILNFSLTFIINILFFRSVNIKISEIVSLLIYKVLLFVSFLTCGKFKSYKIKNSSEYMKISNFILAPEIYNILFYVIICLYFLLRKKLFLEEIKRIVNFKSDKCNYYQGLLNMLNKSFLSFNKSDFRVNCNNSFINFLRKLGLTDFDINYALDVRDIKEYNRAQEKKKALYEYKIKEKIKIQGKSENFNFSNFSNNKNNININNRNENMINSNNYKNIENSTGKNNIFDNKTNEIPIRSTIPKSNFVDSKLLNNENFQENNNERVNININHSYYSNTSKKKNFSSVDLTPIQIFEENNQNNIINNKESMLSNQNYSLFNKMKKKTFEQDHFTNVDHQNINSLKPNEDNVIIKNEPNNKTNSNLNNFTNLTRNNLNNMSDNIINNSTKNNFIQDNNFDNFKLSNLNKENPKFDLNENINKTNIKNNKFSNQSQKQKNVHLENLFLNCSNVMEINDDLNKKNLCKMFKEIQNAKDNNGNFDNNSAISSNFIEDLFLFKLDYLLKEIFDNFYESSNPLISSINMNKSSIGTLYKSTLSNHIREIFYNQQSIDYEDNFNFQGIFYCDVKSMLRKKLIKSEFLGINKNCNSEENININKLNTSMNFNKIDNEKEIISIEVYSRKILMPEGELIEFYFNDITSISKVEKEKAENKIKSLVLAKISHEFKTPLITIIYILKNYISGEKAEISDKLQMPNYLATLNTIKSENEDILYRKISTNEVNHSSNKNMNNPNSNINKNEISNQSNENKKKLKTLTSIKNEEKYINNIIDLSDYMLSLINDIIDFSVIDSSFEMKFQLDFFDLHKMLNFGFRIMKILIDCKGLGRFIQPILDIEENVPQMFYSDEMRIKQVLLNLISNSIKFTRSGYIKIIAKSINFGTVEISIEDTGIGISNADMKKLFIDFGKLQNEESSKLNKIGSGLGLSICKKIIAKLGTQIQVESQQNTKTRFYFGISNKNMRKNSDKLKSLKSLNNTDQNYKNNNKNYGLNSTNILDNKKASLNKQIISTNFAKGNNNISKLNFDFKNNEKINCKNFSSKNMNFGNKLPKKRDKRKSIYYISPKQTNVFRSYISKINPNQDISVFNYHSNRRFSQSSFISDNYNNNINRKEKYYNEDNSGNNSNLFHTEENNKFKIINEVSGDASFILNDKFNYSFEDGAKYIFYTDRNKIDNFEHKNKFKFNKIFEKLDSLNSKFLSLSYRNYNNYDDLNSHIKMKSSPLKNVISNPNDYIGIPSKKNRNFKLNIFNLNSGKAKVNPIIKSFYKKLFTTNDSDKDNIYKFKIFENLKKKGFYNISNEKMNESNNSKDLDSGIKLYKNFTTKEKKINTTFLNKFEILGEGRNGNFINIDNNNAFDGESSFSNSRNSSRIVDNSFKNNENEKSKYNKAYNIDLLNDSQTFNFASDNEDTVLDSPKEIFYMDLKNDKIITEQNHYNYTFKDNPYSGLLNNYNYNDRDIIKSHSSFSIRSEHSKPTQRDKKLIKININNNFNNFNNINRSPFKLLEIEKIANFCILSSSFFTNTRGQDSDLELFLLPIKKYFKKMMKYEKIILIVDDNEIIRHSIKRVIKSINKSEKKENISVICLSDGIELIYLIMIDQTMKNIIKLIISDEQMIYLNGSDCFRILKDLSIEKKINKIPFVFCSSNTECISQFNNRDNLDMNPNVIDYAFLNKPPSKSQIRSIFQKFNI